MSDEPNDEQVITYAVVICDQEGCTWEYVSDATFPESLRREYLITHMWDVHGIIL